MVSDYECEECDALFTAADNIKQVFVLHGEEGHTPKIVAVCPVCGHWVDKDQ